MQLKRDTTMYYVSVCSLPDSADGNSACAFMNTEIHSNTACIEEITNWFDEDPVLFTTP